MASTTPSTSLNPTIEIPTGFRDFAQDPSVQYIIRNVGSDQERAQVYEWARVNGFYSRSEYVSDGDIVGSVLCALCHKWFSVKERRIKVGADKIQFKARCDHCYEKTWYLNYNVEGATPDMKPQVRYVPSGYMLVMKTIIPNYKTLAPPNATWRKPGDPARG